MTDNLTGLGDRPNNESGPVWLCLFMTAVLFAWMWQHFQVGELYRIGPDEGCEVAKASMCARGFHLYSQIWNDQPPLHTWLLSSSFKTFGLSMGVARLMASGFGVLLFVALFAVARLASGAIAGLATCAVLLVSPQALPLSFSVMLEVPAMSVALCSLWSALIWKKKRVVFWLALSGTLMAAALQIKFTSAILIPAILVELVLTAAAEDGFGRGQCASAARVLAIWAVAVLAPFCVIALLFPGWSIDLLWFSHVAASKGAPGGLIHATPFHYFSGAAPMLLGTALFLATLAVNRQWKKNPCVATMLLTVCWIHWFHRPFWDYYILHFDVVMSLASGISASMFFRGAFPWKRSERSATRGSAVYSTLALSFIVFVLVFSGGPALDRELGILGASERVDQNRLAEDARAAIQEPGLLFSTSPLDGFYTGLPLVPYLAIIPPKRFWSGQINYYMILASLKRSRPTYLLLSPQSRDLPGWAVFLDEDYVAFPFGRGLDLFKLKPLSQPPRK
jgi:4-amino-4-deoxy-L-arabinose transferase-like glycosyltransferase